MFGKDIRMKEIFNNQSLKTCIVPLDHAVTVGPIKGLEQISNKAKEIMNGGADAIIVHKGIIGDLVPHLREMNKCRFILHLSASAELTNESNEKYLVSTVEQALKLGAIGVSVHVNLGKEIDGRMMCDLGKVGDICLNWGMPLLAMMYVKENGNNDTKVEHLAHAVKIAEQLGADMVKISVPESIEGLKRIVDCTYLPILISGGEYTSFEKILFQINEGKKYGIGGVSMGRNIFQADDSFIRTKIVSDFIHDYISYEEALYRITNCRANIKQSVI